MAKFWSDWRSRLRSVLIASMGVLSISGSDALAKDLNWALRDSPRSLFAPVNYTIDVMIMSLVQDTILKFGPDGSLQPSIASAWEAPDPLTYIYTIRGDAKFSNGHPVTSADVAFSLNLHLDPNVGSQEAALLGSVASITADGDKVTVKLKEPSSLWKFMPASIAGYVWEKSSVEANLANYGTPQVLPIGSGPYKVTEYVVDSHVTLERNPEYAGDEAQFDKITFHIIPDDQTRLLAMRSGEIDGTLAVPTTALEQWKEAAAIDSFSSFIWRGLTLDMTQAPFDDIHVRRALNYAVDKVAIADGLMAGLAVPSSTVNDPGIFAGVMSDAEVKAGYDGIASFPYDLVKAKAELAQSSVPSGFALTMNIPEDSAVIGKISQALKADWAKIGVDLTLNLMPGGPRFQIILDHKPNLGVQVIGNVPDAPDPVQMAFQYFSSKQAVVNGNNSSNFHDDQVDALLDEAAKSTDAKMAADLVMQAQALASQQVPLVSLIWQKSVVALKPGWTIDPQFNAFWNMTHWIDQIKTN